MRNPMDAHERRVLRYWHIPGDRAGSRSTDDVSNASSGIRDPARRSVVVLPGPGELESDPLPAALSRIAGIVSETLELKEVFAQVAEAAAEVLPFETMGVCRLEGQNALRLYAVAGKPEEVESDEAVQFEDFSPAIRPRPSATQRIDDA